MLSRRCINAAQPPEPADKGGNHCRLYHQVGSKFVSAESLPKTGVSAFLAGDFQEILAKVADLWSLETGRKRMKSLVNCRVFVQKVRAISG